MNFSDDTRNQTKRLLNLMMAFCLIFLILPFETAASTPRIALGNQRFHATLVQTDGAGVELYALRDC